MDKIKKIVKKPQQDKSGQPISLQGSHDLAPTSGVEATEEKAPRDADVHRQPSLPKLEIITEQSDIRDEEIEINL